MAVLGLPEGGKCGHSWSLSWLIPILFSPQIQDRALGTMNAVIGIILLTAPKPYPNLEGALRGPVLQVSQGQKVTSLTACLVNQSLRLDCRHENTTTTPIQYEFSLTRETKKHVLFGTMGVPEHTYRSRTNFTSKYNIKVLYLSAFTNKDEGLYTCELRLSGQPSTVSSQNISVFRGQKVTSLTACLVNQSLRLDCRHENTTTTPIQYEFSLTRETKKHVLFGTMGVPEHTYRSRTNFTSKYNIKVLYLSAFTNKDEGLYTCELRLSGQPSTVSSQNISVFRDKLVTCEGISLLAQSTSWLLLLLLSLSLLQATDFIAL
ncbi:Thy-1 membrane glycoprotein [Tupaia chinensis]|uniref:Thy-1 membrane glycoprotein n=1 Tax=Tupaia chinensis TaxID=246437 RepID=L9KKH2_TUPCH|nr:Thy-1 membrane glycoprotein [Tupaia chinensis]